MLPKIKMRNYKSIFLSKKKCNYKFIFYKLKENYYHNIINIIIQLCLFPYLTPSNIYLAGSKSSNPS